MNITEIRINLVGGNPERLRAYCTVTIDNAIVIRDLKLIDGAKGCFVAMPSRKLMDKCPRCGAKNHLRARFCNDCGEGLDEGRAARLPAGRAKLHADVAHPINAAAREELQAAVLRAYEAELQRSRQPGYQPREWDDELRAADEDDFLVELTDTPPPARRQAPPRRPGGPDRRTAPAPSRAGTVEERPERSKPTPAPPTNSPPAEPPPTGEEAFSAGL